METQGYFNKLLNKIERLKVSNRKVNLLGRIGKSPRLFAISNALDELYFLEKLKVYCQYLSRKESISVDGMENAYPHDIFIPEILGQLSKYHFTNPAISVFLLIKNLYLALEKEGKKTTMEIQENSIEKIESVLRAKPFTINEQIEIYSYLSNYLLKKYNRGEKNTLPKLIQVYNQIFKLRYKAQKRRNFVINSNVFKNMVVLALRHTNPAFWQQLSTPNLKSKNKVGFTTPEEWVTAFLIFYQDNLPLVDKDTYAKYCWAKLYFQQKRFKDAFACLHPLYGTKGLYIKYDIKILYLQTIWELNATDMGLELLSKHEVYRKNIVNSLRKMLIEDNSQLSKMTYQRAYYRNFYSLIRSLEKLEDGFIRHQFQLAGKLEEEAAKLFLMIKNCDYSHNDWFLQQYQRVLNLDFS